MKKMRESSANTVLNQYLREKKHYCYYELKIARGGTFLFSKIEEVQDESLPALAKEGLTWKFSDEDSRRKPCDGGCFPPLPSYLVIKFGGTFYFIEYHEIQKMRVCGMKSINQQQAAETATLVVHTPS